jgi:homoserine O-succinyltransferase
LGATPMPLFLDTMRPGSTVDLRGRNCLTVGLVNNMPDAAYEATERQFLDLLRAVTGDVVVYLKLFSIPEVPRAAGGRQGIAARYRDIGELWDTPLDGLIVSGTEPRAARLEDEPYWPALTKLVDWTRHNTSSTIWSCLAAHAAVLHADGIERRPLEDKLFGVFDCETVADHPLLAGVARGLRVPHSRINDLPEPSLRSSGYQVLSRSGAAGVDAFVKAEQDSSLFVFFQGHPEYGDDSLLREYRRDVGRFLRGECENCPALPQGYFGDEATVVANGFRAWAITDRRPSLITDFPMDALEAGIENTWRRFAIDVYRNWIAHLKGHKAERPPLKDLVHRSRRGSSRMSAG